MKGLNLRMIGREDEPQLSQIKYIQQSHRRKFPKLKKDVLKKQKLTENQTHWIRKTLSQYHITMKTLNI